MALHETELNEELKKKPEKVVNRIFRGDLGPLLKQPTRRRRIKFYSEASSNSTD